MTSPTERLAQLLRESGESWAIDFWGEPEKAAATLRVLLDAAYVEYARMFGKSPLQGRFDDQALFDEQAHNPHKLRAFLQALGLSSSPVMLVMVWRILQGDAIRTVLMQYEYERDFDLRVELEEPRSGFRTQYASADIDDAALLRHWGILKMNGRPVFDGFDAFSPATAD